MTEEIEYRLNVLEASLLATQSALRAVIAASPDRNRLTRLVAAAVEDTTATALASPQPEAFVEALLHWEKFLLPSERDRERN